MKILVSIGSMQGCNFTRLFKILDELCEEGVIEGDEMIAQCGYDNYVSQYYKTFDMIPDDQFKRLIEDADLVICHGGTGTVTSCLKKNKKVVLFPRLSQFNEHYDDHQLDICKNFRDAGYVMCAKTKEELKNCIKDLDTFQPKLFRSQNSYINQLIINFIEKG